MARLMLRSERVTDATGEPPSLASASSPCSSTAAAGSPAAALGCWLPERVALQRKRPYQQGIEPKP